MSLSKFKSLERPDFGYNYLKMIKFALKINAFMQNGVKNKIQNVNLY